MYQWVLAFIVIILYVGERGWDGYENFTDFSLEIIFFKQPWLFES